MRRAEHEASGAPDAGQGERSDEPPSWRSSRRGRAAEIANADAGHAAPEKGAAAVARAEGEDAGLESRPTWESHSTLGSSVTLLVRGGAGR